MKLAMSAVAAAALAVSGLGGGFAAPLQKLPWQTSGAPSPNAPLVRFLYPQQVQVQAGKPYTIQMHFRIANGLHINAHTPLQKSLIGTTLNAPAPAGVKIAAVQFPAGSPYALAAFPSQKLSVYTGEIVVDMRIVAQRGNHLIQGSLRYQACDTNTCFPPRNVPVAVDVIAQ
jgi:hypothetical protein